MLAMFDYVSMFQSHHFDFINLTKGKAKQAALSKGSGCDSFLCLSIIQLSLSDILLKVSF